LAEVGEWVRARRVDDGDEMNDMGNYPGELRLAEEGEWPRGELGMFGSVDRKWGLNVREEGSSIPEGRDWKLEAGRDRGRD
jgi:hypothetical protein